MEQTYSAYAVTNPADGDPEIVVAIVDETDGSFVGEPLANLPLTDADLDHALTSAGWERDGDWTPASFGGIAPVVRARATYDLRTTDRAQYVFDSAFTFGLRVKIQGTRVTLGWPALTAFARLTNEDDGYLDERGVMWIGGDPYPPVED